MQEDYFDTVTAITITTSMCFFIQCESSVLRSRATNPMFTRRRRRRSKRVSVPMHSRHNTSIIRCRVRHREEVHESSFSFLFREIIESTM